MVHPAHFELNEHAHAKRVDIDQNGLVHFSWQGRISTFCPSYRSIMTSYLRCALVTNTAKAHWQHAQDIPQGAHQGAGCPCPTSIHKAQAPTMKSTKPASLGPQVPATPFMRARSWPHITGPITSQTPLPMPNSTMHR